jgi:hypothetical protein
MTKALIGPACCAVASGVNVAVALAPGAAIPSVSLGVATTLGLLAICFAIQNVALGVKP